MEGLTRPPISEGVALGDSCPSELAQLLSRPHPRTLLARGPPGTGKSLLAISLARHSGRPWVYLGWDHSSLGDPERERSPAGTSRALKVMSPSEFFRDFSELRHLLATEREGEGLPVVVLDPWEGVLERRDPGDGPQDSALQVRSFLEALQSLSAHAVLVSSGAMEGPMEFLCDGLVTLHRGLLDSRVERWLELEKVRDVPISHPEQPFTLDTGEPRFLRPLILSPSEVRPGVAPPPQFARRGRVWVGSTDVETIFGPFPEKAVTVIEMESETPYDLFRLIAGPAVLSVIAQGGRVGLISSPGVLPGDLWEAYRPFLTPGQWVRQVRVLTVAIPRELPPEIAPSFLGPRRNSSREMYTAGLSPEESEPVIDNLQSDYEPRSLEFLDFLQERVSEETPNVLLAILAGIQAFGQAVGRRFTPESLNAVVERYVREGALHAFLAYTQGDPLARAITDMARNRLRFRSRAARYYVYGVRPWTPLYGIVRPPVSQGRGEPYRLVRMR